MHSTRLYRLRSWNLNVRINLATQTTYVTWTTLMSLLQETFDEAPWHGPYFEQSACDEIAVGQYTAR